MRVAKVQGKRRTVTSKIAPKRKKPTKSVTKPKNNMKKKATAKPSVEELLQKVCTKSKVLIIMNSHQVSECVEHFEYDLALHYCETALAVSPSNVEVLETTGGLLLELGDVKRATEISLCLLPC